MTFPISPGLYSRELDRSFIVPSTANSIGGIVVHSSKGPTDKITEVTSNKEFMDIFGSPTPSDLSMYSALAFLGRGKRLKVIRVINDATTAQKIAVDGVAATIFTLTAANAGVWGNSIYVAATAPVNGDFTITVVYGGLTVETFTVSRTPTAKDGFGRSKYIEDVINTQSAYIRVTDTVTVGPHLAFTSVAMTGGADDTVAPTDAMVNIGWDMFQVKEDVEVSLLINAGWTTISVQQKMIDIATARKDCFAILDIPYASSSSVSAMTTYVGTTLNANTSYAAIYGGWPYVYDQYNDKYLYAPTSGYVAAVYANTADVSEVWYAPAGSRRGVINVIGVNKVFSEGDRDTLYTAKINPVQNFTGEGIQVYGQKTLQTAASALDRVNVRMLMITIEKSLEKALRPFVFEFNDQFTRDNITSIIDTFMDDIRTRRGVTDYLVVCDTSNNTAAVIDQNKLIVDLYVKPTRVAEFIQLNAVITATGASFTSSV